MRKLILTTLMLLSSMACWAQSYDPRVGYSSLAVGKPAPTPPPNPCAGAVTRGFPALVFTRQRSTKGHVYYDTILSDASGQCQQTVYIADGFAPSYPSSDVNLRYDDAKQTGVIVRSLWPTIAASRYTVTFDDAGVPLVTSGDYLPILALADLTVPDDASLAGWSKYMFGSPLISPDGTKMLVSVTFQNVSGAVPPLRSTYWTCPLDASYAAIDPTTCHMIYLGKTDGSIASAGWGGRSETIYIVDESTSGSGRALYRLTLADMQLTEIWNLGTLFYGAKGRLENDQERVAVYEANLSSRCSRVLVIDADGCGDNGCPILNGAGSPARSLTWLPDGRMAGEGQTAPDRKGKCSASGSIVVFDADDMNGTVTTITPAGSQPDGAGGG